MDNSLIEWDSELALKYLELSALQEQVEGQALTGVMYMSGDGVEQDINKAFNYLEQASQKGSSLAQFFLGEYMNMEES